MLMFSNLKDNSMFKKTLILAVGISFTACSQNTEPYTVSIEQTAQGEQQEGTYEDISTDRAQEMIDNEDITIIDVRTPEEYKSGHIPNARLMNINSSDFEQKLEELPKDEPILVYCHSGNRSGKAMRKMEQKGFKAVYNLEGGISDWKRANNEVVQ